MATNTRKLASLLGASGAGIADAGTLTSAAIGDVIVSGDIADDAIDSEHIVDGSIDLAHMSVNSIDSDQYVDGSIDLAHMSVNSIDSDQYVDGSVDTVHIADDQITLAKMAGGADGSLITYDADQDPELVPPGTTGHILTSRGAASTPTFQAGYTAESGSVVQIVTGEINAGGSDIAMSSGSPGLELSTSLRFSIVPKLAGSKIIISYGTLRTYLGQATHVHFAIGHEVTASGGTATASTLLGQLVTAGGHDQGTHAYWWVEETAAQSNPHYFETFHSPSYTVGQRIWYSIIGWVDTGTQYYSLDSDIRCKMTELKA